jgi:HD superfamily phosphodiesterase
MASQKGKERWSWIMDKEKMVGGMKIYFGTDERRIQHALRVTEYAEQILKHEDADYDVVIAASILHDIGIHEAERKYGSTAGKYQEMEGPSIARGILEKMGVEKSIIDEVCTIIASHHSPGEVNTQNFKVVSDADWLVNMEEVYAGFDRDKLKEAIGKVFLTPAGKKIAKRIYLGDMNESL